MPDLTRIFALLLSSCNTETRFGRWPLVTDHVLMGDGRYRSEADMHAPSAFTCSVENDP